MDEKSKFRQRATTSARKHHFGDMVSNDSFVVSRRRKKIYSSKRNGIRDEVVRSYQADAEENDSKSTVAEEVIESGKRTGEYFTESAGKTVQKRFLKKQMVRAAEQKRTKEGAKEISNLSKRAMNGMDDLMTRIGENVAKVVTDNPLLILCALILGIVLITVSASISSCSMMIGSFHGTVVTTSYTAEDGEILAAETYYAGLESGLQGRINQIETDYLGYDEYEYVLDPIGHDPYELISLLTILHENFTKNEVEGSMDGIFDEQYDITLTENEETRTRTETKTQWEEKTRIEERQETRLVWDEVQKKFLLEEYTYEVEVAYWEEVEYEEEVEYQHYTLHVTLKNQTIGRLVDHMSLTDDQMQRYELLMSLKGNKSYLF